MSGFFRTAGLVLLAAVTVVLCYLALTRDMSADTASEPRTAAADGAPSDAAPESTDSGPAVDEAVTPQVPDQVRADFGKDNELPAGSRVYDNPAAGSPLEVRQGFLTHDPGKAPVSVGSLEVQLPAPVQRIGARIVFPLDNGGTVNLVAWTSSLVDARKAGQPVPTSGLRLIAASDYWQLTIYDKGDIVIAGETFEPVPGPQTFEVYRSESKVWVVDPTGAVTQTEDPLVGELTGPWACWQLAEDRPSRTPARIKEIWAG